jgi:DNA repair exonuclease SbcCD ATPase subunit
MGSPVLKDGVTRCEAAIADLKPTAELERRHAAALRFLKESQAQIQELDDKIPGLEQLRSRVELREQLELERAELPKPTDALAVLEHRSEQLATKVAKSEASEEARAKAETAKRDLTKLGALRDRAVVVEDLREVRRKLAASQAVEAGVRKATDYAAQLSRLRVDEPTDEIEERVEQKAERAKELGREADDLLKRIETGVCPRCRRPWNVSEEEAKKLQERLEAVRLELAPITADVHRDRGLLKDARRRDEIRTALNNLPDGDLDTWRSNNAKLHAREREYVSELERVERADRLRTIVDQPAAEAVDLKSLREHLKRMKQALEEARAHQYLGQRIEKLPTGDVAKVQTRLEGLRDRRAALDSRRQRAREVTAQTAADLQLRERLEHELADYRQRYEQTQKAGQRVRAYQVLQKGWRHLLEARERQKLSRIQELLHNYLEPLYGRQSRWLRVDLAADDGLEPVLYACGRRLAAAAKSPGQVAKLSLGLLFALRDYYGSACSLLVLDEPVFRVDTSARAPFYGILDSLRQSTETIVLISHESELTGCTFDAHIEARIDDTGISSLVEV